MFQIYHQTNVHLVYLPLTMRTHIVEAILIQPLNTYYSQQHPPTARTHIITLQAATVSVNQKEKATGTLYGLLQPVVNQFQQMLVNISSTSWINTF